MKFEVGDIVLCKRDNPINRTVNIAIIHEVIENPGKTVYRIHKIWNDKFGVWTGDKLELDYRVEDAKGYDRIAVAETYLRLLGINVKTTYETNK